ncbi:MAG: 2-keto-4-pentenoate hydratase/2-oxohepta-3-ene-1,7-dioic acid hydratase in catechol pathway [Minisyncoccia bacterium]|jgi:2-keto-4-pentenoate hydratase/2-oxohepta-3-ene-1,7-dioic acid hydratase in catechol pathway
MKIARFTHRGGPPRIGAVDGDEVVSLDRLLVGDDVVAAAMLDPGTRDAAVVGAERLALDAITLLAPVARPPKFFAIGLNYLDHIEEGGRPVPEHPIFFNKQSTCVNDPFGDIPIPAVAPNAVDYEGELGLVIGKECRSVSAANAPLVVAGYTIVNDVSVRDWQRRSPTMTLGKSWDGHGPMGPWLVTTDEILDPHGLRMKTFINGELRQDTTTDLMVFNCWQQIETLSTVCTLEVGDVIATGTSSGVAAYFDPPKFVVDGDVCVIEVEGIGSLENTYVNEAT